MALYAKSNHPSESAMLCRIDVNDCNNNNNFINNYDQLQAALVANAFDNPQLHSTAQFLLQQQSTSINNDIGMPNNMMTSSNNNHPVLQSPMQSLINKGLESTLVSQGKILYMISMYMHKMCFMYQCTTCVVGLVSSSHDVHILPLS